MVDHADIFIESQNLWELMSSATCPSNGHSDRDHVEKVQAALSEVARWSGQEIRINAEPGGWKITVFSCYYSDGADNEAIEIFIPMVGRATVRHKLCKGGPSYVAKLRHQRFALLLFCGMFLVGGLVFGLARHFGHW